MASFGTGGGSNLRGVLYDLQVRLSDYLGMLNQIRAGLKVKVEDQVPKPPELEKYEQMRVTGLPLVAGGLQDQPHIWLQMVGVISKTLELFDTLARKSQAKE